MASEIRSDTKRLKEQAGVVREDVRQIQQTLEQLQTLGKNTAGYWKGEAGDSFRARLQDEMAAGEETMQNLSAIPSDLLSIAGVYEHAEKANNDILAPLSADVIKD